jgi:hypothetical protein
MTTADRIWYAPYGSNMTWRRFRLYLEGGVLAETGRDHCGARDPSPPAGSSPVWMPGVTYFATESSFWTGGRILYDPLASGMAAGRAWLITPGQFCDVMAQEMKRDPGLDHDLPRAPGERVQAGPGHYETIVCTGSFRGHPVVTFCAPWSVADAEPLAPAAAYRAVIAAGLREAFGWDEDRAGRYLASLPGSRAAARHTREETAA